jgi:hypothetical protein
LGAENSVMMDRLLDKIPPPRSVAAAPQARVVWNQ